MFVLINVANNKVIGKFKTRARAEQFQEMAEVVTRLVYEA